MHLCKPYTLPALLTAVAFASPVLAQSSAEEDHFVYLGKSAQTVVMVSGLPATPATGRHEIWIWHFQRRDHARSNATGAFGLAIRTIIDCADRTSFRRYSESYNGKTYVDTVQLSAATTWISHRPQTLGELPIVAVCDPSPPTPRPLYLGLEAARANADHRLAPGS